jgi:hypothetical protein
VRVQRATRGKVEDSSRAWHDAPQFTDAVGEAPRRFVAWTLASLAAGLLAIASFNLLVDPYGTAGTGIFPTGLPRDVSLKADLLDRLASAPDTVVLGSSRALKVDPRRITADTGHTAFNTGGRAGGPPEAYALLEHLHTRFPDARPRVVWILDQEAFRHNGLQPDLVNDPRFRRFLPHKRRQVDKPGLDAWRLFSWSEATDSMRVVESDINNKLGRTRRAKRNGGFRPDGYYVPDQNYNWNLAFSKYLNIYRHGFTPQPIPQLYLQRTLAATTAWGVRPLIVIPPMQPRLLAAVQKLGWTARHRWLLAMLADLHTRYRFDVADMSSITDFGGTADGFYDPVHMRPSNADRLVDVLASRYPGDI